MNIVNKFKLLITLFLVTLSISASLLAQKRPVIALVLSGGGARGGAHVGVLKVLEEKRIPIDMIVGTSMGAFIGGLYASGKSAQEIETLLTTTDWKKYIRTDYIRKDTPMRKKEIEYQYQGRLGLGVNEANNIVLPTGVFKRQPMLLKFEEDFEHVDSIIDFDKLPIPFRAVATDIKNGEAVILKSGSLAHSVYASSSIPGGFQPMKINGMDLVDGGVSDNMPIGVAKKMGADIIIAVDVSENFDKELNVNSYLVVMGQLINILMRKNVNTSIETLSEKDILITPNLEGFTGLDADKYKEIIKTGVRITNEIYEKKLKHLSLEKELYASYKRQRQLKIYSKEEIIDKIVVNNFTYISDEVILGRLSAKIGERLDKKVLRNDILHIYNTGVFDKIEHKLIKKDGENILDITTTPSWDNHGEIRFTLGIEDDFDSHSAYSLKIGYTMFGLNKYGGEWKNDLEIGKNKLISTEFYQPLTPMQNFYIKPSLVYKNTNQLVPAKSFGFSNNGLIETGIKRYGGTFSVGTYLLQNFKLQASISAFKDSLKVDLLDEDVEFNARPFDISLRIDNLDNLNFSTTGAKAEIIWTKEMTRLGGDYDYQQFYIDVEKPFTFGYHNITTYLKYGTTYEQKGDQSLAASYTLGGLFNLSGFVPYSLIDENVALAVIKYRYQIKNGGFFGSLNAPIYAGFSAEIGNTWASGDSVSYDMMHKSGTVYIAADTIFGPFYFAYGFSEGKEKTAYLYLGENF